MLRRLKLPDSAAAWNRLGFVVEQNIVRLSNLELELCESQGSVWSGITGRPAPATLFGWSIESMGEWEEQTTRAQPTHENGASRCDHVVIRSKRPLATEENLRELGLSVKRVRTDIYPNTRQSFLSGPTGGVLLEVVGPVEEDSSSPADASVWGLAIEVRNVDQLYAELGPDVLTKPRQAVQPGRRICAVKGGGDAAASSLSLAIAFMSPSPRAPSRGHSSSVL